MDDISNLIKEAKPLYFERKRKHALAKKMFCLMTPVLIGTFVFLPFYATNNNITSLSYENSSSVSVIEQMGLPTDDYGLLMVD